MRFTNNYNTSKTGRFKIHKLLYFATIENIYLQAALSFGCTNQVAAQINLLVNIVTVYGQGHGGLWY